MSAELFTSAIEECISFAYDNCPIESFAPKAEAQLQALLERIAELQAEAAPDPAKAYFSRLSRAFGDKQ